MSERTDALQRGTLNVPEEHPRGKCSVPILKLSTAELSSEPSPAPSFVVNATGRKKRYSHAKGEYPENSLHFATLSFLVVNTEGGTFRLTNTDLPPCLSLLEPKTVVAHRELRYSPPFFQTPTQHIKHNKTRITSRRSERISHLPCPE